MPCCYMAGHMTNFRDEDYLQSILWDLDKLQGTIRSKLAGGLLAYIMELQ